MSYLSHALEWVRALLRGRRKPGRHRRPAAPVAPPVARSRRPSPDVRGALVVARRRRRDRHAQGEAWQPQPQARSEWFEPRPWEHTGAMVRPYVLAQEGTQRTARTGTQANPWGDGR